MISEVVYNILLAYVTSDLALTLTTELIVFLFPFKYTETFDGNLLIWIIIYPFVFDNILDGSWFLNKKNVDFLSEQKKWNGMWDRGM